MFNVSLIFYLKCTKLLIAILLQIEFILIVTKYDFLTQTILLREDSTTGWIPVTVMIEIILLEINSIRSERSAFAPIWWFITMIFIQNQSIMITLSSIIHVDVSAWEHRFCTHTIVKGWILRAILLSFVISYRTLRTSSPHEMNFRVDSPWSLLSILLR